jgi:hypothetical protein
LNAGRAGLGGGTLGMSEIVISTYNYIQDGDADAFQQHLGGVSMGNLMGAAGAKLSTLKPQAPTKPYAEICTEQQNKIPANIRHCFLAGTLVSKYSENEINNVEFIPIEQIKFSDKVWSFNFSTLQWEVKPVLQTFRTQYDGDIVTINIDDNVIYSTDGHPFWVIQGEDLENRPLCDSVPDYEQKTTLVGRWVYAGDLQIGDVVPSHSFGNQKISALEISTTKTSVYNFVVDDLHNYAIGENEILVHNTSATHHHTKDTNAVSPPQKNIKWAPEPNQSISKQLKGKGQLAGFDRNPNLKGYDARELLSKTPQELEEMYQNKQLSQKGLKVIKKLFEARDLRHGN